MVACRWPMFRPSCPRSSSATWLGLGLGSGSGLGSGLGLGLGLGLGFGFGFGLATVKPSLPLLPSRRSGSRSSKPW